MILFDMDGVVANFTGGALKVHNKTLPVKEITWDWPVQVGFKDSNDPDFWRPLENSQFWEKLDLLLDGYRLFKGLEYVFKDLGFLSNPNCLNSSDGKKKWLKKYFPEHAKYLILAEKKGLVASPDKILIDDNDGNCEAFRKAGGKAILVPRSWNARKSEIKDNGTFDYEKLVGEVITLVRG